MAEFVAAKSLADENFESGGRYVFTSIDRFDPGVVFVAGVNQRAQSGGQVVWKPTQICILGGDDADQVSASDDFYGVTRMERGNNFGISGPDKRNCLGDSGFF